MAIFLYFELGEFTSKILHEIINSILTSSFLQLDNVIYWNFIYTLQGNFVEMILDTGIRGIFISVLRKDH